MASNAAHSDALDKDIDLSDEEVVVIEEDAGDGDEIELPSSVPPVAAQHAHDLVQDATPHTAMTIAEHRSGDPSAQRQTGQASDAAAPPHARIALAGLASSVAIGADQPPPLSDVNPWEVREADRYLRRGQIPSVARAEGVDVLVLGKRNGLYLWILLGQCAGVVILMTLICSAIIRMPAKGIPSTGQIEIYLKATQDQAAVCHFAEMVAARMETWSHWNAKDNPKRVTPYLDPGIRGVYENGFSTEIRDATQYEERHFFEPVNTQYKGVQQETKHVVMVFYKAYIGRGKDERDYKLDRVARRVKILEIAEGPVSAENGYGLYVLRHFDLTEDAWVNHFNENPWDRADGVPETVLKERAKERTKAQEKARGQAGKASAP